MQTAQTNCISERKHIKLYNNPTPWNLTRLPFKNSTQKLSVPIKQLNSVDEWVRELSVALDEFTQCSYGFNIKLLDVPEIAPLA